MQVVPRIYRKYFFWLYDFIKGQNIRRHYKDIEFVINNPTSNLSKNRKEKYLQDILNFAVNTTDFYKEYSDFESVYDFLVINKNLIRDNFDNFKSSKYKTKDCVLVSTSGSTGTPFSVLHNKNKRYRNVADNLFFLNREGYQIGQKLVYIKIWSDIIKRNIFSKRWLQNIYPLSVFRLSDREIEEFIRSLKKDSSNVCFIGYPSAFDKICKYLDKINSDSITCNVTAIIMISEGLNLYTRDRLVKYFGVAPVSRYSNNENGILAQEDVQGNCFIINSASYFIEILDLEKDVPVDVGERGRIVITDLHNYAMPIIRYDTGDVGNIGMSEDGVPYLQSVEGRKLDMIYDTQGNLVPSHISYKLCKYDDYKQFQLVQYGKRDYLIKLNTDKKVDSEKMKAEYKEYFGQDANIKIEYVGGIALLSSGKRKEVTNTYYTY